MLNTQKGIPAINILKFHQCYTINRYKNLKWKILKCNSKMYFSKTMCQ
jgi:hypothetical protein